MWREEPTAHLRWHYGVLQQKWVIETLEERRARYLWGDCDAPVDLPIRWVKARREEWREVPTEDTSRCDAPSEAWGDAVEYLMNVKPHRYDIEGS